MSSDDRQKLVDQMKATAETVRLYAIAIEGESSPEGRRAIYDLAESDGVPPDDFDLSESLAEYPLEIVDQRGREFAVILTTGGPHIEVVADGLENARLEGYWWGDTHTMHGDYLSTFLDYFIERED